MSGTGRSGLGCRCRRCAPRSRPESCLTHTVTHTGKRADGNNGTNRLRPHPFWTKNRRKALYSKGWKALRRLVRMRSAVRICPAAPKSIENFGFRCFFCCKNAENGASQNVGQLPDPHRDPHAEMRGKGERVPERRLCPLSDISYVLFLLTSLVP